jgi:hypothetical protein
MTFKNLPLTIRQGIYGKDQGVWDSSKVRVFQNKIDIYRQGCAEFLCPLGRTTVIIEGLTPQDPGLKQAVWISGLKKHELTWEGALFGDVFAKNELLTSFKAGVLVNQKRVQCSGYRRKIVFSVEAHISRIHLYVWTDRWVEYGFFESKFPMEDSILKIGYWGVPEYPTAYQGPSKFTVLGVEMGSI